MTIKKRGPYSLTLSEKLLLWIKAAVFIYFVLYVFYQSHYIAVPFSLLGFLYPVVVYKKIVDRKKRELNVQFKDMLYSLSAAISAGRSVESAFRDIPSDLKLIYPDKDALIMKGLNTIINKINMNMPLEKALDEFSEYAQIEDIRNFADVFNICRRRGGNILEVIRNSTLIINDKIEIMQEMEGILAEKKLEQKVLNIIPVVLVLLLSISAGEYMQPVFNTLAGRMVMSISLTLFTIAWLVSGRIMDIKI